MFINMLNSRKGARTNVQGGKMYYRTNVLGDKYIRMTNVLERNLLSYKLPLSVKTQLEGSTP